MALTTLRTGNELIFSRQLFDMAKKGARNYMKVSSYCAHKWDSKTNTPKESGTTEVDIVDYIRRKMYIFLVKKRTKDDESDITSESVEYDLETVNTTEAQMDNVDKPKALEKDT